jgi:hypothetical protein
VGTAWYDVDGNGVQNNAEPGIPGATVTLLWSGPDGVLGNADDLTYTTTTDASGNLSSHAGYPLGVGTRRVMTHSSGVSADRNEQRSRSLCRFLPVRKQQPSRKLSSSISNTIVSFLEGDLALFEMNAYVLHSIPVFRRAGQCVQCGHDISCPR